MSEKLASVSSTLRSPLWWGAVVALGVYQLGITLLNNAVFPLFNGIFLEARDWASIFSTLLSLGLYVLVTYRPSWCRARRWLVASIVFMLVGVPVMLAGVWLASPALLLVGTCLRSIAGIWYGTMLCLAVSALASERGVRATMGALCAGWALSYTLELVVSLTPPTVQLGAFWASAFVVMALTYRPSERLVALTASREPASELRITNPRSFLPLGSAVFVSVVLLKASFGFAMTFASVDATPQSTILACVPALLIACALLVSGRVGLDALYKAAMLCVLAGFLLVNPLISSLTSLPALANVVLRAGGDLTRILVFMLMAHLGPRNEMAVLGVSLYLGGANSLGSVVGAQLGIMANAALARDPALLALMLAAVVFAFVAYNVLSRDAFHIDRAIGGVQAVQEAQPTAAADALSEAAARIAKRLLLTPREAEALELLAHGRNTQAIQERMVVSRSTAKTHVRNVYAKLGVHSQQELIDFVEAEPR